MVLDAVSNFVRGTADAAIASGDTTVSVVDASIFPDPATDGEFNVVIWDVNNFPRPDQDGDVEIMRVTERDTTADELTVTRAQEMTSAAAHPNGSAIHLSPTAKMFTDIEDTFTTEAEAADAAPVQSVFGRVGDVVAETGDYAATQISNFSSEVLTSISGSTIAPSEITDLWNGTVVTSDVNNTNTTTEALEAEEATNKNKTLSPAVPTFENSLDNENGTNAEIPLPNSNYIRYYISGLRLQNGDELRLRTSNDGGSTFHDDYAWVRHENTTMSSRESSEFILLSDSIPSTSQANYGFFELIITGAASSTSTNFVWRYCGFRSTTQFSFVSGGGSAISTSVDYVELFADDGGGLTFVGDEHIETVPQEVI